MTRCTAISISPSVRRAISNDERIETGRWLADRINLLGEGYSMLGSRIGWSTSHYVQEAVSPLTQVLHSGDTCPNPACFAELLASARASSSRTRRCGKVPQKWKPERSFGRGTITSVMRSPHWNRAVRARERQRGRGREREREPALRPVHNNKL